MSDQAPRSASPLSWRAGRSAFNPVAAAPARLELRDNQFRAMGCECQVMVLGGSAELPARGEQRVRELETSWTRFADDSELMRFNSRAGHWVRVSTDLMVLLQRGLAGYRISGGLFNPFLGNEISAVGYDQDFDDLQVAPGALAGPAGSARRQTVSRRSRPGDDPGYPLQLQRALGLARLAPGVQFDSGGIGKGLGADLVVADLRRWGANGAMVSLGGDVAVGGAWPDEGWRIGVVDPAGRADKEMSVVLRDGAVCSSGTLKRRWQQPDGSYAHHILDPATGRSLAGSGVVAASAIAPQGWRAEVLTKMALVGGSEVARAAVGRAGGVAVLVWDEAGDLTSIQ